MLPALLQGIQRLEFLVNGDEQQERHLRLRLLDNSQWPGHRRLPGVPRQLQSLAPDRFGTQVEPQRHLVAPHGFDIKHRKVLGAVASHNQPAARVKLHYLEAMKSIGAGRLDVGGHLLTGNTGEPLQSLYLRAVSQRGASERGELVSFHFNRGIKQRPDRIHDLDTSVNRPSQGCGVRGRTFSELPLGPVPLQACEQEERGDGKGDACQQYGADGKVLSPVPGWPVGPFFGEQWYLSP